MKIKAAVFAASLVAFVAVSARAASMSPEAAAVAVETASEVARTVGRDYPADLLRWAPRFSAEGWKGRCLGGDLRSLTARGEAFLMYAEIMPLLERGAAEVKGRERLLEQGRALAAIAGGSLSEMDERRIEKDAEKTRREQAWRVAREEALRVLMIESKWAAPTPDGTLRAFVREGRDFEAVEPCRSGFKQLL